MAEILTFGYGGQDVDKLRRYVEATGAVLMDARMKPSGRQAQWRHGPLTKRFGAAYVHAAGLGNVNFRGGPIQLAEPEPWLDRIIGHYEAGRTVIIMCACNRYAVCHRAVVAERLADLGYATRELRLEAELLDVDQGDLF